MNRRVTLLLIALATLAVYTLPAAAQLIVNPAMRCEVGMFEAGGILALSTVEYEGTDIERQILGGYSAFGMSDWFDLYGSLGLIIDAEPDGWDDSGSGFLVALGARSDVWRTDYFTIFAYSQLQYLSEDYGEHSETVPIGEGVSGRVTASAEGSITELILGAVANYEINEQLNIYGGIDLIPYSNGEGESDVDMDVDVPGLPLPSMDVSDNEDIERDDRFGVRLGANYDMGGWWLRGDLALLSEQTFLIGAGTSF